MNTATAAAVGTSLEVLAPYLPYKIEVENIRQNGFTKQGTRHLLVGLDCTDDFPIKAGSMCYKPEGVLPVLRDFSQLTVPLPTGEVPAVEVARLCWGPELDNYELRAEYIASWMDDNGDMHHNEPRVEVSGILLEDPDYTLCFCILPDWTWSEAGGFDNEAPAATIDYLRSKHFALPVNGRPLVANVDYIPLTAPSTPTREADNTPTL